MLGVAFELDTFVDEQRQLVVPGDVFSKVRLAEEPLPGSLQNSAQLLSLSSWPSESRGADALVEDVTM